MATHVCAIIHGSESHLPELPPNPSYYKRICRAFRKTTLVSPKNPLCRIYFKSYAAITFERKRHVKCDLLHIIHPFSLFRIYWELWMMLVFFCALIINPLEVAFDFETSDQLDLLTVVVVMIDFICIIDITLTFFTGYGIDSTKEVVLDPGKIARNYIFSTAFVGDVLSSVPIKLIRYFLQSFFTKSTWRTVNIFSLLKILRFNTLIHYMGRAADMWQVSLIAFLIIRYSIIMILVIHWTACMHYAVPAIVRAMTGVLHEKSWIVQSNIDAYPTKFIIYIHCLFRACCYLLTITHGMYEPFTSEDILVGIATFIVGTIMLSLVLVLMLQIMASIFSAETKYQEIINQVEEYMGYKQLPLNMQRRLISYYEYRFQKKYFREDAISATLSERLRREINVFCYRRLVDSVSIFKDMPQHIVVDIVNSLKAEIFLPNDIIVKAGTIGECMYFLASGTVCVVTPTGKEVCHLYDGAYFGEIALIMKDQKRIANVIAIEICEVYRLDRKSFKICFVNNVELYKKIERIAQERREKTLILEELHKKYIMALEQPSQRSFSTTD